MHNRTIFLQYKLHHLLFWMLLSCLWYYLRYQDYSTSLLAMQVTIIKVMDLAIMIYITNGLLIPKLLYRKKYAWFAIAFVLLVITSSVTKMNVLGRLMNNPQLFSIGGNLKARIYDNIIPHFFLVIAGAAFKLMRDYGKLQQRMAETAKEKAEAELNFLKSQINPHFLFNSINSVYFLIDKTNQEARNALGKFSDMLRYQLYEMNGDKIPIEKEIRFLDDFIGLQKLRKEEHFVVTCDCSPEVKGFSIEPLLLIPFVENAFKHISHEASNTNFIKIKMKLTGNTFCFEVENSTETAVAKLPQAGGIGLANVKKRLVLLYPERHQLEIHNNAAFFKITLQIKI